MSSSEFQAMFLLLNQLFADLLLTVMRRSFVHLDCKLLRSLYVTFISLLLEFAVSVWSYAFKGDLDLLERVQHQTTGLISSLGNLNYEECLQAIDLTTLSERRQRGDMIQIFKIYHGIDKMEMGPNFSLQQSQKRGHCVKYHREISRHPHRANFIFNR